MERPFIIAITGGSGSGKTSLLRKLRDRFSPGDVCFFSQDDYYRPREEQKQDKQGVRNFDKPQSIDHEAFYADIRKLIRGESVTRQEYTFNNSSAQAKLITIHPAPVMIIEGLFVLQQKEIRRLVDLKVFIHARENLKVIRRIRRDNEERNYPLDDVLYRYEKHVMPTFEKHIRPYHEKADIVINNNKDFRKGLMVLEGFILHLLENRRPEVK